MFPTTIFKRFVAVLFAFGIAVTAAFAHVIVLPWESAAGASEPLERVEYFAPGSCGISLPGSESQ